MKTELLMIGLLASLSESVTAQKTKGYPQVTVERIIKAPIEVSFDYIVPVDLSHIFRGYKKFAAIKKTDETEKWIKAGLNRTVYFEDGTTAQETLLTVVPNISFSYKIEGFTSQLRFLAKRIEGNWQFTNLGSGQTKIVWTYRIIPKNFLTKGIIKMMVLKDIEGMLNEALTILKEDLEAR